MVRRGIYAGSFDPFTIGHAAIVERALRIVDELHIVLGQNVHKLPFQALEERLHTIQELYRHESRIIVKHYDGIIAKYAKEQGALLIRGIRGNQDMALEQSLAEVNRNHFGIETICLFAEPQYSFISSSLVRELATFGEDYSRYIPKKI